MTNLKRFAYGAVFGAGALAVVLFSSGLAEFGSSARQRATVMYNRAVADNLAPICVAQFRAAGDPAAKYAALKRLGSKWQAGFVKENGWATMPGRERPDERIAADCAEQILRLNLRP